MGKHLTREINKIERHMLEIGALVEQSILKATTAIVSSRIDLAHEVLDADVEIDQREVELEEECLKVLALHQPMAVNLRFIVAVIKVNSTLERMGDLACNIARGAIILSAHGQDGLKYDLGEIAQRVREMVSKSLDSLVQMDADMARQVLSMDDDIDIENNMICNYLQDKIGKDGVKADSAIQVLLASRHLERIADLATNIAEDVVFMVEGEIIRHRPAKLFTRKA